MLEWFNALGIPLSEIYGMSETTGPMTWEAHPDRIKPGTVGPAIPGCEVRIADDGEVICRGDNVFQGYFREPAKTADTLIDGWLHSGDIGVVDEDGFVEYRRPQEGADHHVRRQEHLAGEPGRGAQDDRPRRPGLRHRRQPQVRQRPDRPGPRQRGSVGQGPRQGGADADRAGGRPRGPRRRAGRSRRGQPAVRPGRTDKKFFLLGEEWLPDSDVLTPTSKLKRRGVHSRYASLIDDMYAGV